MLCSWENPLFLWPFSMSLFVSSPGRVRLGKSMASPVASAGLEAHLKIKPREMLQLPMALFTSQGEQVLDLAGADKNSENAMDLEHIEIRSPKKITGFLWASWLSWLFMMLEDV